MSLKKKFNPFTGNFDIYNDVTVLKFKEGVATQADLPSSGNEKNDARITNDNHHLYVWDGTQWVDQGDIFNIKWDSIENKPTSSTSDIDDAVSKKHSQNTDTKLDEGGVDEISAHEIKTKLIDINKFSPRNLAKNSIFEYWNGNIPEGWTLYAGSVFQESSDKLFGNYSVKVGPNANDVSSIKLVIDDSGIINYLKGKPVSIGVWAKGSSAQLRLKGYDGTLAQVTGASETSWTFLYAENKIIHQNTTEITIYLDSTDVNDYALFDGLMLIAGEKIISFIPRYEDDIEKNSASRHSQNTDSKIKNADGDTSVETTDSDEIVFKNAGNEVLKILSSGVAKYYNPNRDISDLYHLVDKKYVDEAVTSLGARYYMLDTDSGISDYKLCSTTPSAGSEQSISKDNLTNDQYVIGWISPNTNEPDKLIAGVYNWRIYAEKTGSGTKTLRLYWKLIERKSDNSEVVIGTSVVSNEIVTGKNSYIIPLTLSADYDIASDSYMVGKIYAEVSGSGNDPSIILYYEGNSDSHWKIPVNTEILDSKYVKVNGNQTINDVKTFTTIPILPNSDPTSDNEAVRKKYVDNQLSSVMEKVSEVDVSSDCTYVDFTGLDGNSAWFYKLFATVKNPTGSSTNYFLFVNGDTTETNYYSQCIHGNGTNVTAARYNNPVIVNIAGGDKALCETTITKDNDGYFRYFCSVSRDPASAVKLTIRNGSKTATITNITSLRVQTSVSNAIGAGSKFILFKVRRA